MALARNKTFRPDIDPTRRTDSLRLNEEQVSGPVSFLNPTQARFEGRLIAAANTTSITLEQDPGADLIRPEHDLVDGKPVLRYAWTSRNNRKGRQTLIIPATQKNEDQKITTPPPTSETEEVLKGI